MSRTLRNECLEAPRDLPVVQWLRIHLVMQGMWVQSPVGELRSDRL